MSLTKVTYSMIENAVLDVTNYGADSTGASDSTAAIQSAIDAAGAADGNIVYLPPGTYKINSTLNIPYSNVVLVGAGSGSNHDIVSQTATTATRLLWNGAANGTMVSIYSPSGASNAKQTGCGVKGIMFDGQTAGIGLQILSQNNGNYEGLYFVKFSIACVSMNVVASLGEARDPQQNLFTTIQCRQFNSTGVCFLFDGDATANTSMNVFENIDLQIQNGHGFLFRNSDNNFLIRIRVYKSSGTGASTVFAGSNDAAGRVARSNSFLYYTTNGSTIGQGTTSYTYPSYDNSVFYIDKDNGTPNPTIETGSSVWYSTSNNCQMNVGLGKTAVADSYANLITDRASITTETLRIYNDSSNHVILVWGGAAWGINIDQTNGDMRIIRKAGSGALSLPDADGTSLKIGGKQVTTGTADSGGPGFRLLRVPN